MQSIIIMKVCLMNYFLKKTLLKFIIGILKKIAVEIFKVKLGTVPSLMNTVFQITLNPYAYRNEIEISTQYVMIWRLPPMYNQKFRIYPKRICFCFI